MAIKCNKLGPNNSQQQSHRRKLDHRIKTPCITHVFQTIAIVAMAAFINDDHGQKLKCQVATYSPLPLKVAWGDGLTNYSSHDLNMVLIE